LRDRARRGPLGAPRWNRAKCHGRWQ
jgi:hypothetical protein